MSPDKYRTVWPTTLAPDDAAALLLGRYEQHQQVAGAPLDVLVRARTFEPARCFGSFGDRMCANALRVHDLKEPLDAGAQLFAAQLTVNLRCQAKLPFTTRRERIAGKP